MNRSRSTATTETYTAHYNLSRTTEGASLKGPFKTWTPQPHNLLSESETDTATKRHLSHARTTHNVPSTHTATTNHNYSHYPLMNSRTTPSASHHRVASPGLHRPDHIAVVSHAYPLEPPQSQQSRSKQNPSMLNFIRSHSKESKADNAPSRRGEDLHRAVVTSSKQYQNSSNINPVIRVPNPPVSYSSPSSTETSPQNSIDGHTPVNNVSDSEFHRHHHTFGNSSTGSKLNADHPSRRTDATTSGQRTVDKKAKDRQDMVTNITEAFSPTMSTRPRVPENISLGQLSLLRGDDSGTYKRTTSTEKTLESQYIRSQAHFAQPMPSQLQQRLPPPIHDPNPAVDPALRSNKQQTSNPMSRIPLDPPMRSQPTPTPIAPQSKPAPIPVSKNALPPPPAKPTSSSSRTAANPWPFNQASATERSSKQSSKEQSARSSRTPTASNSANPQSFTSNADVVSPPAVYPREQLQVNKAASRYTGPPVPPKQAASNMPPGKLSVESANTGDLSLSVSKSTVSRMTGPDSIGTQAGYPLSPYASAPPSSSLLPATQSASSHRSKPESNYHQAQPAPNQAPVSDADLEVKFPPAIQQPLCVKQPSKHTSSVALPVPTVNPTQALVSVALIDQAMPHSSTSQKPLAPPMDLALSFVPVETTLANQTERFPVQEYPELEASPLFNDRLLLVRPGVANSRATAVLIKETLPISDRDPPADAISPKLALIRNAAAGHNQSPSGKSTPPETNQSKAPVHIQWIPPPEAETSSLSSAEEDNILLPRFTNTVSQASTAAGVWTAQQKVVLRSGETSYASQAPNLYVAPQKASPTNPPTPSEPAALDVVYFKNTETLRSIGDVPSTKTSAASMDRLVAGAWTTKATTNNNGMVSVALDIPLTKPFENATLSSNSPEAARPNESAVAMTPGAWTSLTKYNNKSTTIFESEKSIEPFVGNAITPSMVTMSSTMRHALNGTTPAGAWTTKATQSDPQLSQQLVSNVAPRQNSRDPSPPLAAPNRHQTTSATGSGSNTPSSSQSVDRHSITSPGTSQLARVPISGHMSTPAPSRPTLRQTPPPLSISSTTPDTDSLLTPSSLNSPRSTLLIAQPPPPPAPVTIGPPQPPIDKEKSSKNRILDFFRHSKPTPSNPTNLSYDVWMPPKEIVKAKEKPYEEKRKELPTPQVKPTTTPSAPMQSHPPSQPKSPKLFSPLKLFSKRNRTMSTASIDALDGTTTTVMNSPSSSAPDIMGTPYSPPIRDAFLATQEWRDNEANQLTRTKRPHRPGVTFDCVEDIAPIHMVPSRFKLSRSYYTEDDDT